MTPLQRLLTIAPNSETELLMPGLFEWLKRTRRAQTGARLHLELPLSGRRVDLALASNSRTISSFELKIGQTQRALEQAVYNRTLFDRSYVVLSHVPERQNIEIASSFGVGIIAVIDRQAKLIIDSPLARPDSLIRHRLLSTLRNSTPTLIL